MTSSDADGTEDEPADSGTVRELFALAREIARATGRTGDRDERLEYETRIDVPGTRNKVTVVTYKEPLRGPRVEGCIARVVWWEGFGEPDVIMGRQEYRSYSVTTFDFTQDPGGAVSATRTVDSLVWPPGPSQRPPADAGSPEFAAWFSGQQRKSDAAAAEERALGAHLFTRKHAEDLRAMLGHPEGNAGIP